MDTHKSHDTHSFTLDDGREVAISVYSDTITGGGRSWPMYDFTIDGKGSNGDSGERVLVPIPWNYQVLEQEVRLKLEPYAESTIREGKPALLPRRCHPGLLN